MRAIQCDRCGEFISGDQRYKGLMIMTKAIPDKIEEKSVRHCDLCFACSVIVEQCLNARVHKVFEKTAQLALENQQLREALAHYKNHPPPHPKSEGHAPASEAQLPAKPS